MSLGIGVMLGLSLGWFVWAVLPHNAPNRILKNEGVPEFEPRNATVTSGNSSNETGIGNRNSSPASCPPFDCSVCDETRSAVATAFAELSKTHPQLTPSGFPKFIADAYAKHPRLARDFEIDCSEVPCLAILENPPTLDDQIAEGDVLNEMAKQLGPEGNVNYFRSGEGEAALVVAFKVGRWSPEEVEALKVRRERIVLERNPKDKGE